ncbi:serine/threonine protein kinase [Alkalilimnicola sp. S0819]|uniref:serine/threonine protein kinase n=1 Tax=Alkalilimnicola sp. S0819 TaxID=2613922 RepID=UPI0012620F83|nr:serine/threonine protein kinase [Alkalilimnicola sp. S0819]KAB7623691.1 serine/threonine protein kinase [Alkalilimnicola sp. S0819]MPQ16819.1 serine/threonine protein kinase [Alkalilimnicola sp. S0819]
MNETAEHPYQALSPDCVLDAVESLGYLSDGRVLALNSYENRVYQVGLEGAQPLVVKFYRPERWRDEQIREEHAFAEALQGHEIPVVAPLRVGGETLHEHAGFRYACYPRRGGRGPELDLPEHREWLGRFLGRIHAVGAARPFEHRPTLSMADMGEASRQYLLEGDWLPAHILEAYESLSRDVLDGIARGFERAGDVAELRLHGDCHPGNILWTDEGPHFVDLDDCRQGPAVQDLWMLLSGDRAEMSLQLSDIVEAYEEFHDFDRRELHLIEALRSLRMMHYAAWLARRWHDPAFPLAFPWFNGTRYWEDHVLALREQLALLDEPPLVI